MFQADVRQQQVDEAIRNFYETLYSNETQETPGADQMPPRPSKDDFMEELARGTFDRRESIDEQITSRSDHWRIERMPTVDRNILRMAIFEMQVLQTPAAVVIDEALELGRQFSGPESVSFLNGILDAIRKTSGPRP